MVLSCTLQSSVKHVLLDFAVQEEIHNWHLLFPLCSGYAGQLFVWHECPVEKPRPGPSRRQLHRPSPALANRQFRSAVFGHNCILFLFAAFNPNLNFASRNIQCYNLKVVWSWGTDILSNHRGQKPSLYSLTSIYANDNHYILRQEFHKLIVHGDKKSLLLSVLNTFLSHFSRRAWVLMFWERERESSSYPLFHIRHIFVCPCTSGSFAIFY